MTASSGPRTDVDALIAQLESFGQAYPEDIFGLVTKQEIKDHGSLISRNSAAMGRHCATFMVKAAAALREQRDEIAKLQKQRDQAQDDRSIFHRKWQETKAERLKCVDYSVQLQQLIESLRHEATPHPELHHYSIVRDAKAERDAAIKKAEQCQCIYVCRRGRSSNGSTI